MSYECPRCGTRLVETDDEVNGYELEGSQARHTVKRCEEMEKAKEPSAATRMHRFEKAARIENNHHGCHLVSDPNGLAPRPDDVRYLSNLLWRMYDAGREDERAGR
jgi:hypothetical protein